MGLYRVADRITELSLLAERVPQGYFRLALLEAWMHVDLARLSVSRLSVLFQMLGCAWVTWLLKWIEIASERMISSVTTACNDLSCVLNVRNGVGTDLDSLGY